MGNRLEKVEELLRETIRGHTRRLEHLEQQFSEMKKAGQTSIPSEEGNGNGICSNIYFETIRKEKYYTNQSLQFIIIIIIIVVVVVVVVGSVCFITDTP